MIKIFNWQNLVSTNLGWRRSSPGFGWWVHHMLGENMKKILIIIGRKTQSFFSSLGTCRHAEKNQKPRGLTHPREEQHKASVGTSQPQLQGSQQMPQIWTDWDCRTSAWTAGGAAAHIQRLWGTFWLCFDVCVPKSTFKENSLVLIRHLKIFIS